MALFRLLQPNSTLCFCRLGFSASRARLCSSKCSDGDGDCPPQLTEEAAAKDTKIILPEHTVSKAVLKKGEKQLMEEAAAKDTKIILPEHIVSKAVLKKRGPRKPKTLSGLFMVHNDDPAKTKAENEERKHEETLSDHLMMSEKNEERKHEETLLNNLMMSEKNEKPSQTQFNGCQNGLVLKHSALQSANNGATQENDRPKDPSSIYKSPVHSNERSEKNVGKYQFKNLVQSLSTTLHQLPSRATNPFSSTGLIQHDSSNANVQRSDKHDISLHTFQAGTTKIEDRETSKSGFDYAELKEQNQGQKVSLPSRATNLFSSTGLIKHDSSNANVQRSDKHDISLHTFQAGTTKVEDRETSKSGFDFAELKEQNQGQKVSLPAGNNDQRQKPSQNSAGAEPEGNRVLVRFLQNSISTSQIFEYFKNCGEILKVECPSAPRPLLKTACIDFKTRDGVEKAISKSGTSMGGPIIVESSTSENWTTAVPIPSLLGDPDIPAALVKNPTRTIRIERLTQEMNSHHIVEALAFCKSEVSGYFLGSSDSVAYVELETEIGKERALAKHSINVLGRNLVMQRIDCPRTTVVRITGRDSLELNQVLSICKSLGDVCTFLQRHANILDVYYKVAEWPNMLRILNRLNGCGVKGRLLQAEPAPVFPPEVLLALWHHPEGRKHLKAAAQELLLKLDSKLDTSELAFLENDIFST